VRTRRKGSISRDSVQFSSVKFKKRREGENERKSKKIESWKTKEGASLLKKMNEITKEIKENE